MALDLSHRLTLCQEFETEYHEYGNDVQCVPLVIRQISTSLFYHFINHTHVHLHAINQIQHMLTFKRNAIEFLFIIIFRTETFES